MSPLTPEQLAMLQAQQGIQSTGLAGPMASPTPQPPAQPTISPQQILALLQRQGMAGTPPAPTPQPSPQKNISLPGMQAGIKAMEAPTDMSGLDKPWIPQDVKTRSPLSNDEEDVSNGEDEEPEPRKFNKIKKSISKDTE